MHVHASIDFGTGQSWLQTARQLNILHCIAMLAGSAEVCEKHIMNGLASAPIEAHCQGRCGHVRDAGLVEQLIHSDKEAGCARLMNRAAWRAD